MNQASPNPVQPGYFSLSAWLSAAVCCGTGLRPPFPQYMRLVLQRCTEASVTVDGEVTGSIGRGLVVLCGIHTDDTESAAEWAAKKLCSIRLWEDASGRAWAQSVAQGKYDLLLVSQFTLFATLKGNKPDFHHAMGPAAAKPFWCVLSVSHRALCHAHRRTLAHHLRDSAAVRCAGISSFRASKPCTRSAGCSRGALEPRCWSSCATTAQ